MLQHSNIAGAVYFLVESGMTLDASPSLESQIVDRVRIFKELGTSSALVIAVNNATEFDRAIAPKLRSGGIRYETIVARGRIQTAVRGAFALRRAVKKYRPRFVYTRDPWGSMAHWIAFPFGGPKLLYDLRGDVVAESKFRGRSGMRHRALAAFTARAIKHADFYSAVSSKGAELLQTGYGQYGASIVPSCVDYETFEQHTSARNETRRELGFSEDNIVVVYSGGTQRYQLIPQMLRIWERMAANTSVRFLLMTHKTGSDPLVLPEILGDRLVTLEASRDQVPRYLGAADIGFLLRAPHPLNQVASPIKFAEYLAAGLTVVASPGIGDDSDLIVEHRIGTLVNADAPEEAAIHCLELVEEIKYNGVQYSDRSRKLARSHFDWRAHVAKFQ